jgi:hypothetical protein
VSAKLSVDEEGLEGVDWPEEYGLGVAFIGFSPFYAPAQRH